MFLFHNVLSVLFFSLDTVAEAFFLNHATSHGPETTKNSLVGVSNLANIFWRWCALWTFLTFLFCF